MTKMNYNRPCFKATQGKVTHKLHSKRKREKTKQRDTLQVEAERYGVSVGYVKPITSEQLDVLDKLDSEFTLHDFKLPDEQHIGDSEWLHRSWGVSEPDEKGVLKRYDAGKTTTSIARYYCTSRWEVLRVWAKHSGNDKLADLLHDYSLAN